MSTDKCLISIIVPVYKVEKYLDRCVSSLVNQTLKNIEIILVDDGSPDSCPEMCDRLAKSDNRIKVVHKKNGGLSSARNAGMKIASGKYMGFVDSDDDVSLDMYEKMVSIAEKYKVDFVMADYTRINADGSSYLKSLDIDGGYYSREKIVSDIFPNLIMRESIDYGPLLSVWHCIYNSEFLREIGLTFDEEVKWSEDNIFSAIMGYRCNSFYYMKGEGLYNYYQNFGTITTSYRKGAWEVYCAMNRHLHEYFDNIKDYDFSRQLKLHMIYYACNCIGMESGRSEDDAVKAIDDILKSDYMRSAFKNFKMVKGSIKLKIQLYLMKWQQSRLIYKINTR